MKTSDLKILSDDEISRIQQHTLELLENTGIIVELKKMRNLLSDHGCAVDDVSKIVKFPASMVERFVKKAPREFTLCGADADKQWAISPETRVWSGLGTPFRMLDPKTGARKDATLEDLRKHLIIFDYLDHITGNQMDIWPQDIPMHTTHVEAIRAWAQNCTKTFGMGAYGVMATSDMMEMVSLVMGGSDKIEDKHPFCGIVSIHSPLSSAQIQLEGLMILAENNMPALVSPEAMAGTTAPVTLGGLLLQHNAEIISHVVMAQVVNPGTPVLYGSVSTVADMKAGTPALGSVETGMISAASAQLAHSYDLPIRAVAGATESKVADVQCGFEREQSMTLAAMGGVNYITCVGTLESTNSGMHELAVIDNEIIARVERALRGFEINDETLAIDTIKRVGPGGNYLVEEHTLNYLRTEHFIPAVTDRDHIEVWEQSGKKNILDHAANEVNRILSEHRPRDLDPKLIDELDHFVNKVAARSEEDFLAAEWEN